jgi:probable F420-dependent oxidoreductase
VRPFRFGVQANGAASAAEWRDLARRAEAAGYDALTMPDHFTEQLAPVPALMAAADATERLRIGALVWDNDYKHPVVLAKELATMDVLSGGRLEIGIGAGWMQTDYDQAGIPYDPAPVRIDRMIEGIEVVRGCMAPGPFSFSGRHYTITGYDGLPKPLSRPPLLVGGGGPRMLRYAAREADIVGVNPVLTSGRIDASTISSMSAEEVDAKVAVVHEAAGDRLAGIEMNIRAFLVAIAPDAAAATAGVAGMVGVPESMVAASPFALVGPPAKLVEDLLARRERWGFSYVIVGGENLDDFAPVVAALAGR